MRKLQFPSTKPLTVDDLDRALMETAIDNPDKLREWPITWMSQLNSMWLKYLMSMTEAQKNLFTPFGFPKELFTQWANPLITLTEMNVSNDKNPDMAAQRNERIERRYANRLKMVVHFLNSTD